MRILITHSFYRTSGGEDTYVKRQASLLSEKHDVSLFTRDNRLIKSRVRAAKTLIFSPNDFRETAALLKKISPDVIHMHNAYPSLGPAIHLAAHHLHIPVVMTVHNLRLRCPNGLMFTENSLCRRCENGVYLHSLMHNCFPTRAQAAAYAAGLWSHRFILRLERKVELFIAPSQFMRNRMLEWGFESHKVRMLRYVTDLPSASAEPGEHGLYLGRLSRAKGLVPLLHALRIAGDPRFNIVGDGPQMQELIALSADLGLRRLTFTGRLTQNDLQPLLRTARFVVFPSLWDENNPLAAYEAMAAGRPLIVSDRGGLPELAQSGRGLICTPGDEHELSDAMRVLLSDARLCSSMGEAALCFARRELGDSRHTGNLELLYQEVLANKESNAGQSRLPEKPQA